MIELCKCPLMHSPVLHSASIISLYLAVSTGLSGKNHGYLVLRLSSRLAFRIETELKAIGTKMNDTQQRQHEQNEAHDSVYQRKADVCSTIRQA